MQSTWVVEDKIITRDSLPPQRRIQHTMDCILAHAQVGPQRGGAVSVFPTCVLQCVNFWGALLVLWRCAKRT